jgi:two-component system nitrate/nitrite response regulator NarL
MTDESLLLIDASRLFREGLRRIFSDSPFSVVHEALAIEDALPFIESLRPSLVLLDLPEKADTLADGIKRIRAAAPAAKTVILTDAMRGDCLADALSAGADGYLQKNMSADALHHSLRLVLLGEKVFPTDLARLLSGGWMIARRDSLPVGDFCGLSDREMQILGCLLDGASNKQIAYALELSDGTVKVHLKAILKKIGAQNRTQAAIWALNNGVASVQARVHGALNAKAPAR